MDKLLDKFEKRNPVRFLERILSQVQALRTKMCYFLIKKFDTSFKLYSPHL